MNQNGIADTIDPAPHDIHATIDPETRLPKLPAIDIRGPFTKAQDFEIDEEMTAR